MVALAMINQDARVATFSRDDERWEAVRRRDKSADGQFYYSVLTTGVYCRPSCPSRAARRENVAFYATCADAERAGFRACKRCQPNALSPAERQAAAVARACRMIERAVENGDDVPALADLAAAVGLSRFHFHRIFKEIAGVTAKEYAIAHRAGRMKNELTPGRSVTEAIYGAGYASNSRFYETASSRLGMRPIEYRDGGRNAEIRFAVGECSLGSVLVAATAKGVCAIELGSDPQKLVRQLEDRFPKAEIVGGDARFEQLVARVIGLIEAPGRGLDLPLDVRGTAFQHKVWQALREIPPGKTMTYGQLASRIGSPGARRAVARACASNPTAVAIPCHRVMRADGRPAGYRWGVERRRALLAREAGS
jgi:AraC family transcriptional regulator of adaptative response/methylated-DNA-[protein]-cysteine methyltransferase